VTLRWACRAAACMRPSDRGSATGYVVWER